MEKYIKFRVVLLLLFTAWTRGYDLNSAETLYTNLTTGYNMMLDPSRPTNISVEFSIMSINILDVKEQQFSVTGYLTATWTDTRLAWTSSNFGNIDYMFFSEEVIWKPELVIQNSAINIPIIDNDELYLKAHSSGTVTWDPPGVYIVNCDVDITYYPYDTQSCYVAISTWSHDDSMTKLQHSRDAINFEDYQENGEWDVLDSHVVSSSRSDRNDDSVSRSSLEFYFTLKRKTPYYVMSVILPPMLTSFLGLMVFLLPAESGEKVGFSITVLLALAVLMTITTTYIPSTSKNTSLYSTYLLCTMFLSAVEVIATIFVLRLHHNHDKDRPVSAHVQKLANLVLAKTSCFTPCCIRNRGSHSFTDNESAPRKTRVSPGSVRTNGSENGTVKDKNMLNRSDSAGKIESPSNIMLKQKSGFTELPRNDGWKEYSWVDIAVMVDNTAFFVLFVAFVGITVGFCVVLETN